MIGAIAPRLRALVDRLRRALVRAGPMGMAGAALLVVAAAVGQIGGGWADAERDELSRERARLLRMERAAEDAVPSARAGLEAYYLARFPSAAALPDRLTRLYALAASAGVEVRRVDYRSAAERATPLQRIALAVPVQGEFARIYGWLDAVMTELPEVGLESISIKRANSEASTVETELRLVMFVRGES